MHVCGPTFIPKAIPYIAPFSCVFLVICFVWTIHRKVVKILSTKLPGPFICLPLWFLKNRDKERKAVVLLRNVSPSPGASSVSEISTVSPSPGFHQSQKFSKDNEAPGRVKLFQKKKQTTDFLYLSRCQNKCFFFRFAFTMTRFPWCVYA